MRITEKGQVTIPIEVRKKLGFMPGTEVEFIIEGDHVHLVRADQPRSETRGDRAVRLLSGSGTRDLGMSTDEIMKLLRGE
jgi:AbrB family looped-hinge helix DNA binding protein